MKFGANTQIWVAPLAQADLGLIDKVADTGFDLIELGDVKQRLADQHPRMAQFLALALAGAFFLALALFLALAFFLAFFLAGAFLPAWPCSLSQADPPLMDLTLARACFFRAATCKLGRPLPRFLPKKDFALLTVLNPVPFCLEALLAGAFFLAFLGAFFLAFFLAFLGGAFLAFFRLQEAG